jgi:hypothetical protein
MSAAPSTEAIAALRHYLGGALAGLGRPEEARPEWELALTKYRQAADLRAEEVVELLECLGDDRESAGPHD